MTPALPQPARTVVVTGAGSGLGLATVLELARLGFSAIGVVRTPDEEETLLRCAARHGLRVQTRMADLADPAQRVSLGTELSPWALVNNAGSMNAGRLLDVPLEEGRRQLEAMVIAPLDLSLQVLPGMLRRGDGRIVNVTSSAAHAATPFTGWYQASKAALRELNDSLRLELRHCGVRVIDLEPGGYRTGIWPAAQGELRRHGRHGVWRERSDTIARRLPAFEARMGDPDQVAVTVGHLLTASRTPAHCRIGPGATLLRAASELLPERLWDWLVTCSTRALGGFRR